MAHFARDPGLPLRRRDLAIDGAHQRIRVKRRGHVAAQSRSGEMRFRLDEVGVGQRGENETDIVQKGRLAFGLSRDAALELRNCSEVGFPKCAETLPALPRVRESRVRRIRLLPEIAERRAVCLLQADVMAQDGGGRSPSPASPARTRTSARPDG